MIQLFANQPAPRQCLVKDISFHPAALTGRPSSFKLCPQHKGTGLVLLTNLRYDRVSSHAIRRVQHYTILQTCPLLELGSNDAENIESGVSGPGGHLG